MTLGVREMARQLDCAASLVSRYKARGMPMSTTADARAWMRENVARDPRSTLALDAVPAADAPPSTADSYHDARARREQAEAELAELKLKRENGQVLDRDSSLQAVSTAFRQLRDTMMLLGRRLAPTLASMSDVREIRLALERAHAESLSAFSERTLQTLANALAGEGVNLPALESSQTQPAEPTQAAQP
jgi:hypothetical protein